MKGDAKIIVHLNKILANELAAINQYFLHARMLKNWGLLRLADHIYHESIDEMHHADLLIERSLFLEGRPEMSVQLQLRIGSSVPEIFSNDLALETGNRTDLLAAIADCEAVQDFQSRGVFAHILKETEEHIDWLETQLGLIERLGVAGYEQQHIHSHEK